MSTNKEDLAREFTSLILPRLMASYTKDVEDRMESFKSVLEMAKSGERMGSLNKDALKDMEDLLEKDTTRMEKVLSGEKYCEMEDHLVEEFCKTLTVAALKRAITQEQDTLLINAIAEGTASVFFND